MFYFTVKYLSWLARVPGLPLLFDALLLAFTCIAHRSRIEAMESLEVEALRLLRIRLKVHRFGGIEFIEPKGRELGHLHGNGLLDVLVGRGKGELLIAMKKVRPHHVFPKSSWISFQLESKADVPFALELLTTALTRRLELKNDALLQS
jgi:hypothetical protein